MTTLLRIDRTDGSETRIPDTDPAFDREIMRAAKSFAISPADLRAILDAGENVRTCSFIRRLETAKGL